VCGERPRGLGRPPGEAGTAASWSDATEAIHPDNKAIVERAASDAGARVAGIDFLSEDITRSWRGSAAPCWKEAFPDLRPYSLGHPDQRDRADPGDPAAPPARTAASDLRDHRQPGQTTTATW